MNKPERRECRGQHMVRCNCEGFNIALDDMEEFLPGEDEIFKLIIKPMGITKPKYNFHYGDSHLALAKALHERISGKSND